MSTGIMASREGAGSMDLTSFEKFAGLCAILTGVTGFVYAIAFVVLKQPTLYSLMLMLGGLLATPVLVAMYNRLREVDANFALWSLLLGIVASLGAFIHGGYDLANSINPPKSDPLADAGLPNLVDPRGVLTFALAGVSVLVVSWLISRNSYFPKTLGYLGYLLAALLVIVYLGRLVILDASSPAILLPAALTGFIANPAWYIWLGLVMWRGSAKMA